MLAFLKEAVSHAVCRRSSRSAIGLDIGSRAVKAVQLDLGKHGSSPRLVAAATWRRTGSASMPQPDEVADWTARLAAAGFTGRRLVTAAPGEAAMFGPLDLPPRTSGAPLDQLARMEVSRNFRIPPDSFEMAWWELPEGGRVSRGTQALAVAMDHASGDALMTALERARFWVEAVDAPPLALCRAALPMLPDSGVSALLDLGSGPATLALVQEQTVVFSRRLSEHRIELLQKSLCEKLEIEPEMVDYLLLETGLQSSGGSLVELPDDGRRVLGAWIDALAKELMLSFGYAAHLYPDAGVARLLLAGGGAAMCGLADKLTALVGVETQVVAPPGVIACEPSLLAVCQNPAYSLALGLALQEVNP